jgi:protein-tyrosine phosphatase
MVDIHCHILPGLDDGAADLETSLEMCRVAADDGIEAIVCAMHANDQYAFDPELVARAIDEVQQKTGGTPRLYPGCDFHLSYENVQSALNEPRRHTVNHGSYLLVEFADLSIPPNIAQVFFQFCSRGMIPVVTHPERNAWLQSSRAEIIDWVQAGSLVQITAGSLLGDFGRRAARFCRWLLERQLVHFVATDAHNATTRPPRLKKAYELVAREYSPLLADRIFKENPTYAVENRLFDGEPQIEQAPPGFWQRIAARFR